MPQQEQNEFQKDIVSKVLDSFEMKESSIEEIKKDDQLKSARPLTEGEKAVGYNFNPSLDPNVDNIKKKYADIIDLLLELQAGSSSQKAKRHFAIAITDAESAQMRAVKAITWKD